MVEVMSLPPLSEGRRNYMKIKRKKKEQAREKVPHRTSKKKLKLQNSYD